MKHLSKLQPERILIRMPNWLGDIVMATPLLEDLRHAYPKAEITAMCRAPMCELLRYDPNLTELFCYHEPPWLGRREARRDLVEKIREGKYDLGIVVPRSFSSAWWLWQGHVKVRIGFGGNGRGLFLTDSLPYPNAPPHYHEVIRFKHLLLPLGIPLSKTPPRLYITDEEKELAADKLKLQGAEKGVRMLGISPGAAYGSAKMWLPERFRELAIRLLEEDRNVVLLFFGDASQLPLLKEICEGLPPRAICLAGATGLRELVAMISLCSLLITGDSGPMHIADALEVPLIALFGSTSDLVTGPYRGGKIIHKRVECSPCLLRRCPIDFRCMKRITVEEVLDAARGILRG